MLKPSIVALALIAATPSIADISVQGSLKKWHPITLENHASVVLSESQYQPNAFLDYRFNVFFTSPSGTEYRVPGYFAGDGKGSGIGSVWQVKFSADEVGEWQYRISFREGTNVSVSLDENAGNAMPSDGETGSFKVAAQSSDDPELLRFGRLEYIGEHYLKHADGSYWIKGGVDSPENFLGFAGFDNTVDQPDGAGTEGLQDGIHRYPTHVADWQEGDPLFENSANPDGAKGIIGAINYLSSEAVNSIYFLPMNLGGDGRETYPFINTSGSRFDNTHYDISKLYQWSVVLDHMQNKDIAAHVVLAETEGPNTNWFDDGQLDVERKLFYREMVARFSHLMALKWNISEESHFGHERHRAFATYISALDWADHPITVHTPQNRPDLQYDGIVGDPLFQATSIQFLPDNSGQFVEEWRRKSVEAGWPWVIDMDEPGTAQAGVNDSNVEERRKEVLYPVYFSGGNLEWYFGYHSLPRGGDMRTEDFRTRELIYRYMRYARELMIAELPFWEMSPDDTLHSAGDQEGHNGGVEVFAKAGSVYAVYLRDATDTGTLTVSEGEYTVRWFNPRDGQFVGEPVTFNATDSIVFDDAPQQPEQDWVVLVKSTSYVHQPPSVDLDQQTDEPVTSGAKPPSGGSVGPAWLLLLLFISSGHWFRKGKTR